MLGAGRLVGNADLLVDGVTTIDAPLPGRICFADAFQPQSAAALAEKTADLLLVTTSEYEGKVPQSLWITEHPRESYSGAVRELFKDWFVMQREAIHPKAVIAESAYISPGVVVGDGAMIGDRTLIYPNVVVGPRVRIGADCVIKSGTVIGQSGFGIFKDGTGRPHELPHVGGVIIGDRVLLGALNTVASGTIHPTVLEDDVKTDDHVHIAHNCRVGSRSLLTACAELSGSVRLGEDCWMGPNSSVREKVTLGDGAFVSIGGVVLKDVPENTTVFGVPATALKQRRVPAEE